MFGYVKYFSNIHKKYKIKIKFRIQIDSKAQIKLIKHLIAHFYAFAIGETIKLDCNTQIYPVL